MTQLILNRNGKIRREKRRVGDEPEVSWLIIQTAVWCYRNHLELVIYDTWD
jgi:hypothetical protein